MKILLHYLKPYKWLVALVLSLAAINIGFSLFDPIIFGKLIHLATYHEKVAAFSWNDFLFVKKNITDVSIQTDPNGVITKVEKLKPIYGIVWLLLASISVAMISRFAKAFQDYF